MRSGRVVGCHGHCFEIGNDGCFHKADAQCPCVLSGRCPNDWLCNSGKQPRFCNGHCVRCTVGLSATTAHKLPERDTCPICLGQNLELVEVPAHCGHGVCVSCFRDFYLGPPLPNAMCTREAYADRITEWFTNRPLNWEQQACPVCRARPSKKSRIISISENSMVYRAKMLNSPLVFPVTIVATMLLKSND